MVKRSKSNLYVPYSINVYYLLIVKGSQLTGLGSFYMTSKS